MTDLSSIDLHSGILPSHMKVDIWEEYARHVLSWLEPSIYSSLVLSDRPDLIDTSNSLGVEVTWSIPEESKEIDALYMRYCIEREPAKRNHIEERLSQLNASVNEYACFHPTRHDDLTLMQDSYERKLRLLNESGYKVFNHNHLFMLSDICASKTMLQDALLKLEQTAGNYAVSFERVVVAVPGYVYTFSLFDNKYHAINLSSSKQYELAMAARQCVLDAERTHAAK